MPGEDHDHRFDWKAVKRRIISAHLAKDHRTTSRHRNETVEEQYDRHKRIHEMFPDLWNHTHEDFLDFRKEPKLAAYAKLKPKGAPRVRTDRKPTKWTVTYHLAFDHGVRVKMQIGDKHLHHMSLHDGEEWAGLPGHEYKHTDWEFPGMSTVYKSGVVPDGFIL